jgi:PAS domain S-box-containing protein
VPVVERNRSNSLRVKLVALILATISLPAGLFLYQSGVLQGWLVNAASDRILKVADAWVDQESAQVAEVQRALRSLAVDPAILGAERGECLRALRAIMAGRRGMVALHVVRRDGTVLCSTDRSALPTLAGWAFLSEVFNGRSPSISGYERLPGRQDALLFGGVPLSGRPGEALVAALDLSWMRTAEQNAFGFPFVARLIDRTGHEIAVSPDTAAPLAGQLPVDHPTMPRLMIESEGTADGHESDGVEKLFAFAQLPESGAKLLVAVPRIAVLGQSDRALWVGIALLALGLAGGIVAAWLAVELFLLRWLDRMVEATRAIAGGRFTGNLAVAASAGELAQLGEAMNEMHRQLEARQRQFRDIAQISSDWFWERDLGGRFTFFSERFEEVTGFSAAEVIARSLTERADMALFADEDEESALSVRRALADGRPFRDAVCSFKRPDGTLAWWRISGIPVFGADGMALTGFRGTGTDVTAAKLAEAALLEAKHQAELANSAKTQFLATMSHELRTPLHAVIGFAELMESQSLGPLGAAQYLHYCRDIRESGQQLLRVVTAILDMSQIENDRVILAESEIDAGSLIAVAARMMRERAAARGLPIAVEAPVGPITVIGDERRLLQGLLNLLANAVKFTPAPGTIRVSAELLPSGELALRVRDSGIGMTQEALTGIGRPFWQADGTFARKHDGVGLGLALTKRLMQLHGGALEVESAPGAGTLVTLLVPRDRVGLRPEAVRGAA